MNDYIKLINNVYVASKKDLTEHIGTLVEKALPVSTQKGFVYVFALPLGSNTIMAPLTKEELWSGYHKTLQQFEKDYRPKSFAPILTKVSASFYLH